MMRVITGSARGKRIETLFGEDVTRPTAESVKEALFSMIQFDISGKKILDLFAGSGQLGIEALSRGAESCVFVENDKNAKAVVCRNVENCGFLQKSQIYLCDSLSFLLKSGSYDIAFLDPPYHSGLIEKAPPMLDEQIAFGGIIVCETARNEELPESFGNFSVWKCRNYGKTKLTLYRKES
ncbi:MAG: 16S rRNA (guanine(966)-N(2))-methyltransferase RsmD [Clostridiales bacterium]|nr:16S rRNA (guanine(966)-N(2))-methyltransferase RsmD [Clostridiales bacterium]